MEIFVPVTYEEYKNYYEISNFGNVRSLRCNIIMSPYMQKSYKAVHLRDKGKEFAAFIHRLVALAFIPNPNGYKYVNHIDGNKLNNIVSNLEWSTQTWNTLHAIHVLKCPRSKAAVKQLDLNGNVIAIFDSIKEAAISTGAIQRNISGVCKGDYKTSGGYKWEYLDENRIAEAPVGRTLPEFPNYIITENGQVYSIKQKKYMKLETDFHGYKRLYLSNGKRKSWFVHDLVATLYHENPYNKKSVNHLDENKSNNYYSNLEWATHTENSRHSVNMKKGENFKYIAQCDNQGNIVKLFNSYKEAADATNCVAKNIASACRRENGSSGGIKWKFA